MLCLLRLLKSNASIFFSKKQTNAALRTKLHLFSYTFLHLCVKFHRYTTTGPGLTTVKMAQCKGMMSVWNRKHATINSENYTGTLQKFKAHIQKVQPHVQKFFSYMTM